MSGTLREAIRAVADPLIGAGYDSDQVRQLVFQVLGVGIGGGGGGPRMGGPTCGYCGAFGGGGHGGLCPNSVYSKQWVVFPEPDGDDPCEPWPGPHMHMLSDDGRILLLTERLGLR